jgi:hypothetical protein
MAVNIERRTFLKTAVVVASGSAAGPQPARASDAAVVGQSAPDMSLATQRRRAQRMLESAVEGGDRMYDDNMGLIATTTAPDEPGRPDRKKYVGHWVGWSSPNYANALLETGQRIDRVNRIISVICDHMEPDPASPSFGNIHGIHEWKAVKDSNAIVFALFELAPLWIRHRDKLKPQVRSRLQAMLELGTVGLVRHNPVWFYSNIFLMTVASTVMLARALQRDDLANLAASQWRRWLEKTAENSLVEANSPDYYSCDITALLSLGEHGLDDRMQSEARRAADFMFVLLAGNYHLPSRMQGGTMCRAYMDNCLYGDRKSTRLNSSHW